MTARLQVFVFALVVLILAACTEQAPVKGFVLPPGDAAAGQQVFVDFHCYFCHEIPGVDFPEHEFQPPFIVTLGGTIQQVNNYGELLTAVVYPDHRLAREYLDQLKAIEKEAGWSPMPYFGDQMTVTELIDVVEFLNGQYVRLLPGDYQEYYPFVP